MKLRAKVRHVSGNTRHARAHLEGDEVREGSLFPDAVWAQIEPADDAFYLLYLDADGKPMTDTWHETLGQAKQQAEFEFGIMDDDWNDIDLSF